MPPKKSLLFFAIFFVLYELTTYLSNDMIMPAMLMVVKQFHAPLSSIAASLSLYIIGGSLLQIFLGPIADKIGKRKVLILGNIWFLAATLIIPFSASIHQFLAARLLQGMGLCFIFIGYAVVHELFNDVEAVRLTAILSNVAIFAPLIGPVIGSGIAATMGWQPIFIISGILGLISLAGLFKYMPSGKITGDTINLKQVLQSYKNIFTHKTFMFGIGITGLALMPTISWIGLSPVMILDKMHQSFKVYITYQCIIFAGFIVSSTLIQKLAGNLSFYTLIIRGASISFLGLILASIFNHNGALFISSMFIYSFGLGLYNGAIIRIALMSTGESTSLASSAMSLINCLSLAGGLEISNQICQHFNYTLKSYSIVNLIVGVIVSMAIYVFARYNKDRKWNSTAPALAAH